MVKTGDGNSSTTHESGHVVISVSIFQQFIGLSRRPSLRVASAGLEQWYEAAPVILFSLHQHNFVQALLIVQLQMIGRSDPEPGSVGIQKTREEIYGRP